MTVTAASGGSAWTPLFAFAAGAMTAVGPCAAPRFVAIVGLTSGRTRTAALRRLGAFAVGTCAGYAAIASTLSLLRVLGAWSAIAYAVLAACFGAAAIAHAFKETPHSCRRDVPASGSAAFLTGASLTLVASPCCAPVLVLLASVASFTLSVPMLIGSAAAFALGHVAPLLIVGSSASGIARRFQAPGWSGALATVNTGLFLGLCAYYTVLS